MVTSTFDLARFGSVTASAGERLIQFTECNEPDAAALATYQAEQALRTLIVDDGRSAQNIRAGGFSRQVVGSRPVNTLRAGTQPQRTSSGYSMNASRATAYR